MKLTNTTLTMMRGSAGAFIAAAALSSSSQAGSTNQITSANDPSLTTRSERGIPNAEPPKKEEEQAPKKGHECKGCGLG